MTRSKPLNDNPLNKPLGTCVSRKQMLRVIRSYAKLSNNQREKFLLEKKISAQKIEQEKQKKAAVFDEAGVLLSTAINRAVLHDIGSDNRTYEAVLKECPHVKFFVDNNEFAMNHLCFWNTDGLYALFMLEMQYTVQEDRSMAECDRAEIRAEVRNGLSAYSESTKADESDDAIAKNANAKSYEEDDDDDDEEDDLVVFEGSNGELGSTAKPRMYEEPWMSFSTRYYRECVANSEYFAKWLDDYENVINRVFETNGNAHNQLKSFCKDLPDLRAFVALQYLP